MAYRFDAKPKALSFGSYYYISLKVARELRNEAKELLAKGIDPSAYKRALQEARKSKAGNSIEILILERFSNNKQVQDHAEKILSSFKNDAPLFLEPCPLKILQHRSSWMYCVKSKHAAQ